jgi:hypothetical protein
MKVLVLYRQKSDHRQVVEDLLREYRRLHPETKIETLDLDSREGIATASLYDVTAYPSFLALRNDGSLLQLWQGQDEMPRIDDISYYASGQL